MDLMNQFTKAFANFFLMNGLVLDTFTDTHTP